MEKFLDKFSYKKIEKKLQFEQLTEKKYKNGQLCSSKEPKICVIVFGDPTPYQHLAQKFENDPVTFVYLGTNDAGSDMQHDMFSGSQIVLYKGKRQKYMLLNNVSDAN